MDISTFMRFQRQAQLLSQQFDTVGKLQAQISSGKKLINGSDDPVLANQIQSTQDYIKNIQVYDNNGALAQGRMQLYQSTIQYGINTVGDIQTIIQTAKNGTVSDWHPFITKLQQDLAGLLRMSNTQDASGGYVFSGYNSSTPPYVQTGTGYQYQGTMDAMTINVGTNNRIAYNESGYSLFGNILSGNGTFTATAGSGNTGTAITDAGSANPVTYVEDTYTISFVTNGNGDLAYQVVGASSGQVIPVPPATTPTNAPAYNASGNGTDIAFNGIKLNISGQPSVGDTFTVQPSTKQNVFDTVQNLIDSLDDPAASKTKINQALSEASASMTQVQNRFITYQSDIGIRTAVVDKQIANNSKSISDQQAVLSHLGDVDVVSAITQLSQQSVALQATQQSYLVIQNLLSQLLKI